ncbi:MAG: hypothetical protein GX456_14655 [Verrucomicrobia bacterium]|nr:hypothetical protein [Verrucomicrobiota bacterium]
MNLATGVTVGEMFVLGSVFMAALEQQFNRRLTKWVSALLLAGMMLESVDGADAMAPRIKALAKTKRIATHQLGVEGITPAETIGTLKLPYFSGLLVTVLWDDFRRADTVEPGAGEPPIGSEWLLIGAGGTRPSQWGMVQDGYLTASQFGIGNTVYACQRLKTEPVRLDAVFRWETIAQDGADGTFVLAVGPDEGTSWIRNLVHVRFRRNAVIYDTIIGGIMWSEVALKRFEEHQLAYGVDHHGTVILDWDAPRIKVYLNDELMFECSDAAISRLRGTRAFWEMYYGSELPKSKIMIGGAAAHGKGPYWCHPNVSGRERQIDALP